MLIRKEQQGSAEMGCDGGTIPTRGELVKTKKKPEKLSKDAQLASRWRHCALSQQPLRAPIVACQLGRLYNKEVVIEALLGGDKPADLAHVSSLKDVKVSLALRPSRVQSAVLHNRLDLSD